MGEPIPETADGETQLQLARTAAEVNALIANGVFIDATNYKGQTALITAARDCRGDVIAALLAAGADMSPMCMLGWNAAFSIGEQEIPNLDALLSTIAAFMDGDCRSLGDSVTAMKTSPALRLALRVFRATALSATDKHTAIEVIAASGPIAASDVVTRRMLMEEPLEGTELQWLLGLRDGTVLVTAKTLCGAASSRSLEEMRTLLRHGDAVAHINDAVYLSGVTPLHVAAGHCRADLIELFLTVGADVCAPRADGHTALHVAMANGAADVATLLLAAGADVNTRATGRRGVLEDVTPLHVLMSARASVITPDTVRLLVDAGADVNAHCIRYGTRDITPLDLLGAAASWREMWTAAVVLLDSGASGRRSTTERLARHARKVGRPDMADSLERSICARAVPSDDVA